MEMEDNGWVKLYRQSIPNGWLTNQNFWAFWTYCLMKASHKKHKIFVGNKQVTLEPGQFVYGRKVAAKETGLSTQVVRTCLEHLVKLKNLTSKSTNKFTIVTVCNWETYQGGQEALPTNLLTNNQPTNNQQITTNKNVKNVKNKRTYMFVKPTIEELQQYADEIDFNLDVNYYFHYYEQNGWVLGNGKPMEIWKSSVQTWKARELRKKREVQEAMVEIPTITGTKEPWEDG